MKTLMTLFYRLTMKDYNKVIDSAKQTTRMIKESTNGRLNHFYNDNGEKIRGYHKPSIKFSNINQHPLITRYQ